MFLLLAGGAAIALFRDPSLQVAVGQIAIEPRLPTFALRSITWSELAIGSLFLALPQVRDFSQLETCSRTYSRRTKKLWPHTLSLRLRTSKGP